MAVLFGLALASEEGDALTVYDHDLRVHGPLMLSHDTFEVHGNVTVEGIAELALSWATLIIVGPENGSNRIEVMNGGKLYAENSTIRGSPSTIAMHIFGTIDLTDCTLENMWESNTTPAVLLQVARMTRVTARGCPNGTWARVWGGTITARDCDFIGLGNVHLHIEDSSSFVLEGCTFDAGSGIPGDTKGVLAEWIHDDLVRPASMMVSSCTFSGFGEGIRTVMNTSKASAEIEGCEFSGGYNGIYIVGNRGNVNVADCRALGGEAVGFRIYVPQPDIEPLNLTMTDLYSEGYDVGINIMGPVGKFAPRLLNVTVLNCNEGIHVLGSTAYVEDSNVTECVTCFVAENKARIEVRRTDHAHRSGAIAVPQYGGAVVAFSTVTVSSCGWRGAHPLPMGWLYLYGDDGLELERVDLADPQPKEVVAWSLTRYNDLGRLWIVPTVIVDDVRFEGGNFSVYNTSGQHVEIVDHLPPVVNVTWPEEGHWFNTSRPDVAGSVVEWGSGLDQVVVRIVGGQEEAVGVTEDGNWSFVFDPVSDGQYAIEVMATDLTGGSSLISIANVSLDTVAPAITLEQAEFLLNTTSVFLVGHTEPDIMVHAWEVGVPPDHPYKCNDTVHSDHEGRFVVELYLGAGEHNISIRSTDRAGNQAFASAHVVMDPLPPRISLRRPVEVLMPSGDVPILVIVNVTDVEVAGHVWDDGLSAWVRLWVHDVEATLVDGDFSVLLDLADGVHDVDVRAEDEAGNKAGLTLSIMVDSTPPVITVVTPAESRFFTEDLKVNLQGEVDEIHLDELTLNGYPISVIDGIFTGSLQIEEGENVFTLVATDTAGNEDFAVITILRDLTPPQYTFSATMEEGTVIDVDGTLYGTYQGAGHPRIVATFDVSEWSRVTTAGGLRQVEGEGTLLLRIELEEGDNSFTFNVVDEAGNMATAVSYRIVLDTTPPSIVLDSQVDGLRTKAKVHRLLGRVDEGSSLTLNGEEVAVNADGTFSVQVDLVVGENVLELHATDRVGLESSMNVTIVRKREAKDGPGLGEAAALAALVTAALVALAAERRRA